jgi:hypothetical protein
MVEGEMLDVQISRPHFFLFTLFCFNSRQLKFLTSSEIVV